MGIKGLSKVIKEYCVETNVKDLNICSVAIDTSIYMHKYAHGARGEISAIIKAFISQHGKLAKAGISKIIYVFDNKSHKLKGKVLEARKQALKERVVFPEYYTQLQTAFSESGIEYTICEPDTEAEQHCAALNKKSVVDAVISDDYDTLVFGCNRLITKLNSKMTCTVYDTKTVLEGLNLTQDQLIKMCVFSGCDYHTAGVPGYGPKKATLFIKNAKDDQEIQDLALQHIPDYLEIIDLFNRVL